MNDDRDRRLSGISSPFAVEAFDDRGETAISTEWEHASPFGRSFEGEAEGWDAAPELEDETAKELNKRLTNLSLLPHTWESGGIRIDLTPVNLSLLAIYSGASAFDVVDSRPLQVCLNNVMKKFPHMKAAIVDLTDGKIEFGGFHHTEQVDVEKIPKIAAMLAAFQLRRDLRETLDETHPAKLKDLFSAQRHKWAAAQTALNPKTTPPGPFAPPVLRLGNIVYVDRGRLGVKPVPLKDPKSPNLEAMFSGDPAAGRDAINFTSTGEKWGDLVTLATDAWKDGKTGDGLRLKLLKLGLLERLQIAMSSDSGILASVSDLLAGTIVRDISHLYIASVLLQSGIYDPNRGGGLWLGSDYGGGVWKKKPAVWSPAPAGGSDRSATAGSLAAYLTMLALGRLVDAGTGTEVAELYNDPFPILRRYAGFKEGIVKLPGGDISLTRMVAIGGFGSRQVGTKREEFADDCAWIERSVEVGGGDKLNLSYVAVGLRAKSSYELMDFITAIDQCIMDNNQPAAKPKATPEIWMECETVPIEREDGGAEGDPEAEGELSEEEIGKFGKGTRGRVGDSVKVPFRWICQISATRRVTTAAGTGSHRGLSPAGTGLLISPRHVLTAAHILKSVELDQSGAVSERHEAETVRVRPGRNDDSSPFGEIEASSFVLHKKFNPESKNPRTDYAVITLEKPVGDAVFKNLGGKPLCFWGNATCGANTWFDTLPAAVAAKLIGAKVYTAGYPESKKKEQWCFTGNGTTGSAQLEAHLKESGQTAEWYVKGGLLQITADAEKGQSGSPVWVVDGGKRYLVGILVQAGTEFNTVVGINDEVMRQVREWMGP